MTKEFINEVEIQQLLEEVKFLREKVKKQKAILDKYADLGIDVFHED